MENLSNIVTSALAVYKEPSLEELNTKQVKELLALVSIDKLKEALKLKLAIAKINWQNEKSIFLNSRKSYYTIKAYSRGLTIFENWAYSNNIEPISLSSKAADDYIYSTKAFSIRSRRLYISSVSSFYTFLHRRYEEIANPFIGTKAIPHIDNIDYNFIIPSSEEVGLIINYVSKYNTMQAVAIVLCAYNGLRIGALPTLRYNERLLCYEGISKGKPLRVILAKESLIAIKKANLDNYAPFKDLNINLAKHNLNYHSNKLYRLGDIRAAYSYHDFRHYFSVKEYETSHDIYRLERLLNHSSIKTTEIYLKGLLQGRY